MSSGRGRARVNYDSPLRKPGKKSVAVVKENDEAIVRDQKQETSNDNQQPKLNISEESTKKFDEVLLKAVNTAEFIPKHLQGATAVNSVPSISLLATAVHAPEFVPRKAKQTPTERIEAIRTFVNVQINHLQHDPGYLDDTSNLMVTHLSLAIKVENDLKVVADVLFEKCLSEPNFQYIGAKLANYLDKRLFVQELSTNFRTVFLKRCKEAQRSINEMILNNPVKVVNVAMFLGELFTTFMTVDGVPIDKFREVVTTTIKSLLESPNPKHHICVGKLLKLTGNLLDQNEEIFKTVESMVMDPSTDRTAQTLFKRVCELKNINWNKNDTASSEQPSSKDVPGRPFYIPTIDDQLAEQEMYYPVCGEEEWNDFNVDEDPIEQLYREMSLEQYGYYTPYTTEDGSNDDYDKELEDFLKHST